MEAVPRGQTEAALALGLSRRLTLLRVVLPQAGRTVLPPLANEFVAMIKDSALVSVLGVAAITLSILVRALERRLQRHRPPPVS